MEIAVVISNLLGHTSVYLELNNEPLIHDNAPGHLARDHGGIYLNPFPMTIRMIICRPLVRREVERPQNAVEPDQCASKCFFAMDADPPLRLSQLASVIIIVNAPVNDSSISHADSGRSCYIPKEPPPPRLLVPFPLKVKLRLMLSPQALSSNTCNTS